MSNAVAITPQANAASRKLVPDLKEGDKLEVVHQVKVGQRSWTTTTQGTVLSTERRRHGLHNARSTDDKVWSDIILLRRDDGELTTVTMDDFTVLRRVK